MLRVFVAAVKIRSIRKNCYMYVPRAQRGGSSGSREAQSSGGSRISQRGKGSISLAKFDLNLHENKNWRGE